MPDNRCVRNLLRIKATRISDLCRSNVVHEGATAEAGLLHALDRLII